MTTPTDAALKRLDAQSGAAVNRLMDLLAIPSVSTDPAYGDAVGAAAGWVAGELDGLGMDVTISPTSGHPIVLATTKPDQAESTGPRVLFYGHYDVQPPDPIDAWDTPPFEPDVRDGAVYARGASDDKGQVCCFVEALRAWLTGPGKLPCPVTVLIEGEEECGSVHLPPFIKQHQKQLAADIAVVSDTTMWPTPDGPVMAITYGLRGLLYFDLQLTNADRDLHSGMYGGIMANPANELARVLGKLFDDNHKVTVPRFYDDVLPVTDAEHRAWSELAFDEHAQCLTPVGISTPYGEADHNTLERRWARPSCDVNGLYGGYGGEGAKTVIPSMAGAKVSFRLAPNQNPNKIADAFVAWLQSHDVHGCRWKITQHGAADPVVVPADSPYVRAASQAIAAASGRPPVLVREGATIPVVADFKKALGLDTLLIGFGLPGDRIHSPNEHFALDRFKLGCQTHTRLLAELSTV